MKEKTIEITAGADGDGQNSAKDKSVNENTSPKLSIKLGLLPSFRRSKEVEEDGNTKSSKEDRSRGGNTNSDNELTEKQRTKLEKERQKEEKRLQKAIKEEEKRQEKERRKQVEDKENEGGDGNSSPRLSRKLFRSPTLNSRRDNDKKSSEITTGKASDNVRAEGQNSAKDKGDENTSPKLSIKLGRLPSFRRSKGDDEDGTAKPSEEDRARGGNTNSDSELTEKQRMKLEKERQKEEKRLQKAIIQEEKRKDKDRKKQEAEAKENEAGDGDSSPRLSIKPFRSPTLNSRRDNKSAQDAEDSKKISEQKGEGDGKTGADKRRTLKVRASDAQDDSKRSPLLGIKIGNRKRAEDGDTEKEFNVIAEKEKIKLEKEREREVKRLEKERKKEEGRIEKEKMKEQKMQVKEQERLKKLEDKEEGKNSPRLSLKFRLSPKLATRRGHSPDSSTGEGKEKRGAQDDDKEEQGDGKSSPRLGIKFRHSPKLGIKLGRSPTLNSERNAEKETKLEGKEKESSSPKFSFKLGKSPLLNLRRHKNDEDDDKNSENVPQVGLKLIQSGIDDPKDKELMISQKENSKEKVELQMTKKKKVPTATLR